MKRYKISLFDLLLLLLVVLAGGVAYWQLHHTTVEQPTTAEVLLDDIYRSAERYTDQSAMEETEDYVVDYKLRIQKIDKELLNDLLVPGVIVYNFYDGTSLGTLKSVEYTETDEGCSAELTISVYSQFYKTYIVALPSGAKISVGNELSIRLEDDTYIGTGTITWIKH